VTVAERQDVYARAVDSITNALAVQLDQPRQNKALHPTAYSLRSGRASLRFGFRRRVSLVVMPRQPSLRNNNMSNTQYTFSHAPMLLTNHQVGSVAK
jgi:hypothetical protein